MKDAHATDELELANVEQTDLVTNQEGVVLPWFVGDQIISVRWISNVEGIWTREVDVGGKK